MSEENVVYIGNKPVMNYVLAVVTQMNSGVSEVILKARGRAISRAVDVAEIVRNKFITDVQLGSIDISTEEIKNSEGRDSNVSTIEIQLKKWIKKLLTRFYFYKFAILFFKESRYTIFYALLLKNDIY